jgi:hypothetical protein
LINICISQIRIRKSWIIPISHLSFSIVPFSCIKANCIERGIVELSKIVMITDRTLVFDVSIIPSSLLPSDTCCINICPICVLKSWICPISCSNYRIIPICVRNVGINPSGTSNTHSFEIRIVKWSTIVIVSNYIHFVPCTVTPFCVLPSESFSADILELCIIKSRLSPIRILNIIEIPLWIADICMCKARAINIHISKIDVIVWISIESGRNSMYIIPGTIIPLGIDPSWTISVNRLPMNFIKARRCPITV